MMTNLFYIQLITSFIVGGSFIALLSFLAERADRKIAGIVLSLPSTVVISFLFIGWATSAQAVGQIAPTSVAADGAVMIFTVAYMYLSRLKLTKVYSLLISLMGGLTCWFIISLPLAIYKLDNIVWGIIIFLVAVIIAYYFLTHKNNSQTILKPITYSNKQKIGRTIFAGLVIVLAVYLSKTLHPFWGGIFSGFPAAFLSTFIILHWYYDSDMLFKIAKTVPTGSLVYVPYVILAHWTFPAFGIIGGTFITYAVCLLIFLLIYKIKYYNHVINKG